MCTHKKYVLNHYNGRKILVKCGKCAACQQEKANQRASRINHASASGLHQLFLTLTYDNKYIPYIRRTDLENLSNEDFSMIKLEPKQLPIYRDTITRRVRVSADYRINKKNFDVDSPIDFIPVTDTNFIDNYYLSKDKLRSLKNGDNDKIGICYYKDLQDFIKRLRIILERKYNYVGKFSYFFCSEIGPTTGRPHFHGDVLCPRDKVSAFKSAISEAWAFSVGRCRSRQCEDATKPAAYIASYVNRDSDFPKLFEDSHLRPKHSFSAGFSADAKYFSLDSLLEKASRNDLSYTLETFKNGVPEVVKLPIPEYIINRYFPKFKGYCKLADVEIRDLLLHPDGIFQKRYVLDYTLEQCSNFVTKISNSFKRYSDITKKSLFDYSNDFLSVRRAQRTTLFRNFYNNEDSLPFFEQYDNIADLLFGVVRNDTLLEIFKSSEGIYFELDPNMFLSNIQKSSSLEDLYYKKKKTRKVTNVQMVECGCFV